MASQQNFQKNLMSRLADDAFMHRVTRDNVPLPGSIITGLSTVDREILSKMTSDDLINVRWPRPDNMNLEKLPYNRRYRK